MAKKRNALDALMPEIKNDNPDSVINTDLLDNNSVNNDKSMKIRRRRPLKEKAMRQTYSLYPRIIKGVERYADAYGMTYSQVVTMCLTNVIPMEYFNENDTE